MASAGQMRVARQRAASWRRLAQNGGCRPSESIPSGKGEIVGYPTTDRFLRWGGCRRIKTACPCFARQGQHASVLGLAPNPHHSFAAKPTDRVACRTQLLNPSATPRHTSDLAPSKILHPQAIFLQSLTSINQRSTHSHKPTPPNQPSK
jgi:hypothetical protein